MFDLETALATWRDTLQHQRAFTSDDLDELEAHLRDHIAAQRADGASAEAAFRAAVRRLGDRLAMTAEYEKVYWIKAQRERRLFHEIAWEFGMFANYIKIALRHMWRHKGYALLNIGSLVIGLTMAFLLFAFVAYEHSFEPHIPNLEQVHRIVTYDTNEEQVEATAMVTPHLAPVLTAAYPQLEVARVYYWVYSDLLVRRGETHFYESRFYRADSTVLEVFGFDLVAGDAGQAFAAPNSLLLTEAMARKYFGRTDVLGETLEVNDQRTYTITGVVRDLPPNTHFHFDFLAFSGTGYPGDWSEKKVWTYVRLPEQIAADWLKGQLAEVVQQSFPPALKKRLQFDMQPLADIHLTSHLDSELAPNANANYLSFFLLLAGALVLVAAINYINLTTAQSLHRAREVGVRKVMGALRGQLLRQFLTEALLLSGFVAVVSLFMVKGIAPLLAAYLQITPEALDVSGGMWIMGLLLSGLLIGVLAGLYPAVFLSAFRPVEVLKNRFSRQKGRFSLKEGLLLGQFIATLFLLVGTGVLYQQFRYMQSAAHGIERAQTVVVTVPRPVAVTWDWEVELFRNALQQHGAIKTVGAASVPWRGGLDQHRLRVIGQPNEVAATALWVSEDAYLELYGLTLKEGRGHIRQFEEDQPDGVQFEFVLNEQAIAQLGLGDGLGNGLGETVALDLGDGDWSQGVVVGVVEDFHFRTLHEPIQPLVFLYGRGFSDVFVRLAAGKTKEGLAHLGGVWSQLAPAWPLQYTFLDQEYAQLHAAEAQATRIFSLFAVLSLVVASLGLFGLSAFSTQQRTKEIGIRKVVGASVLRILWLLLRQVVQLVFLACLIAMPLAYFMLQSWLAGFAYRVSITPTVFIAMGILLLCVTLLTVIAQVWRAARRNPIESLRYE